MARLVKQARSWCALHDTTGIHDDDVVCQLRHHTQVMADELDGHTDAVLQLQHQLQNLGLYGHVQRCCGFVSNQQAGPAGQRHSNHCALAHATRQLVRVSIGARACRRNTHLIEHLNRPLLRCAFVQSLVQQQGLADLLTNANHWVQRRHRLLKNHGDLVTADGTPLRLRLAKQLPLRKMGLARHRGGGRQKTHQRQRSGRLAATALPHQAQSLAGSNGVGDVVHGTQDTLVGLETNG